MANNNTNKAPATIKPKKKPGWIRACFGLGSSNKTRVIADRPVIDDDVSTAGGGPRRGLGSRLLQAVKRPWCKKKEKTTSSLLKIRAAKAVGGSTASKVAVVETASQKSLIVFLDDEALQAQGPIGGSIQEEVFDIAEDNTSSPTCLNQSRSIKEPSNSRPHKSKATNKPIPEEHFKLKDERGLARALSKQYRSKATTRSSKDPLIGMSILIVTLVIMLLRGRICAILCTSVCFYCMPQLAKTTKTNTRNAQRNNSSVRSEIERKRVVLMGFLERKQNIFC